MNISAARSIGWFTPLAVIGGLLALAFFLTEGAPLDWFLGRPQGESKASAADHLRLKADNTLFSSDGEPIVDVDRWIRIFCQQSQAAGREEKSPMQIVADRDARYGALCWVIAALERQGIVHRKIKIDDMMIVSELLPDEAGNELPPIAIRVRTDQNGFPLCQ